MTQDTITMLTALCHMAQEHDPETGHYKTVNPYELYLIIHPMLKKLRGDDVQIQEHYDEAMDKCNTIIEQVTS